MNKNPIDRFVFAELKDAKPAPASPRALVRRVALSLTGLPPSPADIDAFVRDQSPEAYERMVDRFLTNPHYGEHRARFWLEAAHYRGEPGHYRDWAIHAFNANLPFDRFSREQLAGDAGFLDTARGGDASDRAHAACEAWLGLNAACPGPVSREEFKALEAFFADLAPTQVSLAEQQATKAAARLKQIDEEMLDVRAAATRPFEAWLVKQAARDSARVAGSDDELYTADIESLSGLGDAARAGDASGTRRHALYFSAGTGTARGLAVRTGLRLEAASPFSVAVTFKLPEGARSYVIAAQENAWRIEASSTGLRAVLMGDAGQPLEARASDLEPLALSEWTYLVVTYDGSRSAEGIELYRNGKRILHTGFGTLTGDLVTSAPLGLGPDLMGGAIADFRVVSRALTAAEATTLALWSAIQNGDREKLFAFFLENEYEPFRRLTAERHAARAQTNAAPAAPTRLQVAPATPAALPAWPESVARDRSGLARWLFLPGHPLTARVAVNRMWQELFGAPLAAGAGDFSNLPEPPQLDLLDWLAADFRESGWDVKRFYKQVLMSAAYRQAGPPRPPMGAAMLRDYALAASGLLSPEIGGAGAGPYRRSIYLWRESPAPVNGECGAGRDAPSVPPSRNDVQLMEASRALASRAMQDAADLPGQLDRIATRVLGRPLTTAERDRASSGFDEFRRFYSAHSAAAEKLLSAGEAKADPALGLAELAALTMLANQMLSLSDAREQ